MSEDKPTGDIGKSLMQLVKQKGLPPVHLWNPPFCGDIDMRIDREGKWHYNGSPIGREAMVKLFASVMRRDNDDCYYLVTPVEKVRIQVEDMPFIIVSANRQNDGKYHLETNTGDPIQLDAYNPLFLGRGNGFEEAMLYILVRDRLYARFNRNVYYQLVNDAEERISDGKIELILRSGEACFSIGEIEEGS